LYLVYHGALEGVNSEKVLNNPLCESKPFIMAEEQEGKIAEEG